jgi:hypothetical protein
MEKHHDFARVRIDAGQIGTLVAVAAVSGPREVFAGSTAAVLSRDNMFQVKTLQWRS